MPTLMAGDWLVFPDRLRLLLRSGRAVGSSDPMLSITAMPSWLPRGEDRSLELVKLPGLFGAKRASV